MKYFYDSEFLEDGVTIEPISIGIVDEDGREFYAVFSDAPWERIKSHEWLCENVIPHLPLQSPIVKSEYAGRHLFTIDYNSPYVMFKRDIAIAVRQFIKGDRKDNELWASHADYDHVLLAQLFGRMIDLPPAVPMFTHDLAQERKRLGKEIPPMADEGQHHALADAKWVRFGHAYLELP